MWTPDLMKVIWSTKTREIHLASLPVLMFAALGWYNKGLNDVMYWCLAYALTHLYLLYWTSYLAHNIKTLKDNKRWFNHYMHSAFENYFPYKIVYNFAILISWFVFLQSPVWKENIHYSWILTKEWHKNWVLSDSRNNDQVW